MLFATLFRKTLFWAIFALLSIACAALAAEFASKALPVVAVDIRMDRAAALESATELAHETGWGPRDSRHAAAFGVDNDVQSFVELGAGGTDDFKEMVEGDLYSPYQWQVRLYREGINNEALVSFTPKGEPYGFFEKIGEDEPGAALSSNEAKAIAEQAAREWPVDLSGFELIQASDETKPSGRIDHSFVYERPRPHIGKEGTYRLRLTVSGDKVSELRHFIKIPESFNRSYEELRSANDTIASAAFYAAAAFFGIGGLGFGLFFLLRRGLLEWKKPALWGVIVAGGLAATQLSDIPLAEMTYDTAISREAFVFGQVASALGSFVGMSILFTIIFMGAEGLTRTAFPHHLQVWKLWSRSIAGTKQVLGRTLGGYLILGVDLAILIGFYLFARTKLGWYVPSSFPVDPNVVATYAPWLPPIGISFYAAFIEESIFRAVPIASAVLLGRRYGRTTAWVVGAFIVQAVVFGAAHANYEAQPAYARLVELLMPALFFGLLYYFFGLLPAVLLHFSVDVAFFSIPLFATSAEGIWLSRGAVIAIALIPLWVSLAAVLKNRKLSEAPADGFNRAWTPPASRERAEPTDGPARTISGRLSWGLLAAGVVGLGLYLVVSDLEPEPPSLQIDRNAAVEIADAALRREGFSLGDEYERLVTLYGGAGAGDLLVWRTAGEAEYRRLIGTYLAPPHYKVRFARFSGDLVERAEEWTVAVDGNGAVRQITHQLPETASGIRLNEEDAREIAHAELKSRFGLVPNQVREVSAVETNRPARTDWTFVLGDPSVNLPRGQARIRISLAGDAISDFDRFIHVPDEWTRRERNRAAIAGTIESLCYGGLLIGFLVGLVISIIGMVRHRFDSKVFGRSFVVLTVLSLGSFLNYWPALAASLSTAQPVVSQLFVAVGGSLLSALAIASGLSIVIGHLAATNRSRNSFSGIQLSAAAGAGLVIAAVIAVVTSFSTSKFPTWPDFIGSVQLIPILNLAGLRFFFMVATAALLISSFIHRLSDGWTRRRPQAIVLTIVVALVLSGNFRIVSLVGWLVTALGIAVVLMFVYLALFVRDPSLVPIAVAVYLSIPALRQASFAAFPGAQVSRSIQITAMLGLGFLWAVALRNSPRSQDDEG